MADNRYNQMPPGYHGGPQMVPGMTNVTAMRGPYMQPNMPMNPMMQQQMMMRFPMQGMRMGPPNTPPPPYSAHQPPGVLPVNTQRAPLSKGKGIQQKSDKERFMEQQRQKLKQFGRPGAMKVDTDSLIGSMFKVESKPIGSKQKGNSVQNVGNADYEDDGFGDFLQGPALESSNSEPIVDSSEEMEEVFNVPEEKKDLTSMMMECSDLTAPQKAKGFHKPTLNEVHRPRARDQHRKSSFHESDHSRSWKTAGDLDGLFQLPVAAPVPIQQPVPTQQPVPAQQPVPTQQPVPFTQMQPHMANAFHAVGQAPPTNACIPAVGLMAAQSFPNANMSSGPVSPGPIPVVQPCGPPPTGPPPSYSEASANVSLPPSSASLAESANQMPVTSQATHFNPSHPNNMISPPAFTAGPAHFPDWCSFNENQVPPVYKQIFEASLLDGQISTERLYPILLLSGLPREKLAQLWSLCNTGTPGLLVKTELWLILALIALTQNNYDTSQVNILVRCPVPPIPVFSTGQAPTTLPSNVEQPQQPVEQSPASVNQMHAIRNPVPQKPEMHGFTAPIQSTAQIQPCSVEVARPAAVETSSVEDDFADFQAAPAASNFTDPATISNRKDMQQEENFGEFMFGGPRTDAGISNAHAISDTLDFPPYLPPRHCNHHRTSMGNGHVPSGAPSHHSQQKQYQDLHHHHHHHHPHQQQQLHLQQQVVPHDHHNAYKADGHCENMAPAAAAKLEMPSDLPPLSTLCLEDKYSGNVRSFFCSSDSSTGHTSPSFEDDDFTDGRDSFSQVSTSEHSEVDDIHNFEHYVEEFNHSKKEKADGSPLHCPFPSVQQNHVQNKAENPTSSFQPADGKGINAVESNGQPKSLNSTGIPPVEYPKLKNIQKPLPGNSSTQSTLAFMASQSSANDSDFADFKSAPTSTGPQAKSTPGMSRDDKYSALREIPQDDDLMQSSVFAEPPVEVSAIAGNISETGSGAEEEEEWANFAEAPPPPPGHENQDDRSDDSELFTSELASSTVGDKPPQQMPNVKDGILKLFAAGSTSTPNISNMSGSVGEGMMSMVNSDSGYSTRSLGNSNSDHLTSMFDSSPTKHSSNKSTEDGKDMAEGNSFWNQSQTTDSGIESNWACFGGHETTTGKLPSLAQSSSMPVFATTEAEERDDDEWGDFSHMSTSSSSFTAVGSSGNMNFVQGGFAGGSDSKLDNHRHSGGVSGSDGDWADFNAPPGQNNMAGETMMDANGANMVTIKKQNLGTNEIMGLFKVRDDPATLSTYQLPPQPPSSSKMGHSRKHSKHSRSGSSGHGRRISSDLDDDMVPPPMDSDPEDGDDDHTFSRGYDLDDFMQRPLPATTYSPFGSTSSPLYSRALGKNNLKLTESKEDSGSVNSLELPSAHQAFDGNGHGDNQSTSSMEMGTGTGNSGMASEESKSLDSLDFKSSEYTEQVDESGKEDTSSFPGMQQNHHQPQPHPHPHPVQPQDLFASMPQLADKYNIDGIAQGNDKYSHEWERCLDSCCRMLTEANTIFNNVSSSAVCNEVLKSLQGWEYVSCVIEIYRVGCRVMTAMRSTAISSNELEQTLKEIDLMWNNLSAFLVGASLLPDPPSLVFTNAILKSDQDSLNKPSMACGLCLLNVDTPATSASSTTTTTTPSSSSLLSSPSTLPSASIGNSISSGISGKLNFAGRYYHSTCANFWVNCVDQTLPSLVLPELL